MADGSQRTAEEREAARRERANRRARREGRPVPYGETSPGEQATSPGFDATPPAPDPVREPMPDPVPEPAPDPVREPTPDPIHEPTPVPVHEPAWDPVPEPTPDPVPEPTPDPVREPTPDPVPAPTPEPAPGTPDPVASDEPLVTPREGPPEPRPIKSFPSPPDPEFYVPDDELEVPSGTRRVSRGARGGHRPPRRGATPPVRRRSGGHRWLGRAFALLVVLVVAAIVYVAIQVFQPFGTSPHGQVTVRIPGDTSASDVAALLARRHVIASKEFFELRTALDGDRSKIRAGTYRLQRGMSYGTVLAKLTAVPKAAKTSQLTIDEGHTRQYVAKLLRHQHVRGDYLAASRHSPLLNPRHYGAPKSTSTLEGFLFPDTFTLRDPIQASALVADQLRDFKRRFAGVRLKAACPGHLTAFQVLTVASLIQAEAANPRDDRLVASVVCNRLRDHMMLQLDSTARYATGNFTGPLLESQLESRSPYNTHTHFGLPPGPIDSPGLDAIRAAADPAVSRYLYFFSKPCTTRTVFATSYAQFNNLLIRDKRTHCPH